MEVELRKICTTLWHGRNFQAKTVKTPGAREVFGGSNCVLRGRDFGTLQNNTGQAEKFAMATERLAGVVGRGSETMLFAWQAHGFRALQCRCLKLRR